MDPNQWMWANGEYVPTLSPSPFLTDCDYSGNPGFFPQESDEEFSTQLASFFTPPVQLPNPIVGDMLHYQEGTSMVGNYGNISLGLPPLGSSGSGLDICNNSPAAHQLVVGPSSFVSPDILYPTVDGRTCSKGSRYSHQDVEKLIEGVEKYKKRTWKRIKLDYFQDSSRTEDQLKDKWRRMVESADTQTDPILKELFLRAKNVDASIPKKYKKSLYNFSQ